MYKLEPILEAFESTCKCKITLHDPQHFLYDGTEPLIDPVRYSHRRTFPCHCAVEERNYCIKHCLTELELNIEKKRYKVYLKRCRSHFFEVIAPLYVREGTTVTFFAGIWTLPLPRKEIRQIMKLLPLFASGLLEEIGSLQLQSQMQATMKNRIESYISQNYAKSVSTSDLAGFLSLSLSRTCHLIKDQWGKSFFDLLTEKRMFHAKLFLKNTDYRINEIASYCGFKNVEHFNRTFKSLAGRTPKEFRYAKNNPSSGVN